MSAKNDARLGSRETARILRECDTGVLCMSRKDEPYGVPVSYAVLKGVVIVHCGMEGRKLDFIRANPRVCLAVSRHPDPARPHQAEGKCSFRFESVLCFGRARIVASAAERLTWLRLFKARFYKRLGLDPESDPVTPAAAERTACVLIRVDKMTGRSKGARQG